MTRCMESVNLLPSPNGRVEVKRNLEGVEISDILMGKRINNLTKYYVI